MNEPPRPSPDRLWPLNIARYMVYPGCKLANAPFRNLRRVWRDEIATDPGYAYGLMSAGAWFGWALLQTLASVLFGVLGTIFSQNLFLIVWLEYSLLCLPLVVLVFVVFFCSKKDKELTALSLDEVRARFGDGPVWEVDLIRNRAVLLRQSFASFPVAVFAGAVLAVIDPFHRWN